jgi:mRNA-degrading endonuclease RelE of RelBE toxin-antitoxin system
MCRNNSVSRNASDNWKKLKRETKMIFKKLLNLFVAKQPEQKKKIVRKNNASSHKSKRKGELGEYKINIQLDQLPKECKYLSDIMIINTKSKTGYSQIDHVVISPYGIFVIETKNYSGEIKGSRNEKFWTVNRRFKLYNPLFQNFGHIKALHNVLPTLKDTDFISIISFTMRSRFNIDPELRKISSNQLVIYDTELSEFIHRKTSRLALDLPQPILEEDRIEEIYSLISEANIIDQKLRSEHVKAVGNYKKL